MSFFDDLWDVIKKAAPVIGTIIGGPEGAAIAAASQALIGNNASCSAPATAPAPAAAGSATEPATPVADVSASVAAPSAAHSALLDALASGSGQALLAQVEADLTADVQSLSTKAVNALAEGLQKL